MSSARDSKHLKYVPGCRGVFARATQKQLSPRPQRRQSGAVHARPPSSCAHAPRPLGWHSRVYLASGRAAERPPGRLLLPAVPSPNSATALSRRGCGSRPRRERKSVEGTQFDEAHTRKGPALACPAPASVPGPGAAGDARNAVCQRRYRPRAAGSCAQVEVQPPWRSRLTRARAPSFWHHHASHGRAAPRAAHAPRPLPQRCPCRPHAPRRGAAPRGRGSCARRGAQAGRGRCVRAREGAAGAAARRMRDASRHRALRVRRCGGDLCDGALARVVSRLRPAAPRLHPHEC